MNSRSRAVEVKCKLLDSLSPCEVKIIACVYFGCSSKEIAEYLSIAEKRVSFRTIDKHIENILYKFGFKQRFVLIKYLKESLLFDEIGFLKETYSVITTPEKSLMDQKESPEVIHSTSNNILSNIRLKVSHRNLRLVFGVLSSVFGAFFILIVACTGKEPLVKSRELIVNKYLIDRRKIVKQIDNAFNKNTEVKIVSLVGCGGAGKTTLARGYLNKSNHKVSYEINAETELSIKSSFIDLAYNLAKTDIDKEDLKFINGISNEKEKHTQFLYFVQKKLKEISDWLIVLDNLEDLNYLKDFCPHDPEIWGRGCVIVTTRNENIRNVGYLKEMTIIPVCELEEEEKKQLFKNILDKELDGTKTKEFLRCIPSYPLDVSSAAYYIKNSNIDFTTYLERAKNITEDFINANKRIVYEGTAYDKTRYGIVSSSFAEILKKNAAFKDLLLLICLFDSQEISLEVLRKISNHDLVDNFIFYLRRYSLISSNKDVISIHRSTQNMGLNYILNEMNIDQKKVFVKRLTKILTPYEMLNKNFRDSKKLISHLKSLVNNLNNICLKKEDKEKAEIKLLVTIGNLYKNKEHSIIDSLSYFDKALSVNNQAKYLSKTDVFKVLLTAGEACVIGSQNDRAMQYLTGSFVSMNCTDKNILELIENHNFIGIVHMRSNNLEEANKCFDKSILLSEKLSDSAELRLAKAISYANKGFTCYLYNINKPKMHDAVKMLEQATALMEKNLDILSSDYKDELIREKSIKTLVNIKCRLGGIYNSLKEYKKSLVLENEAEKLQRLCKEEDNSTLCNLGLINMEKGHANLRLNKLKEARNHFAIAKNIFDKAQIGDHWTRLRMQETEILVRSNQLEEAYKNCEDVFLLKSRDKNDYNELFFNTCHYNAAVIKYKQKDMRKSLEHFKNFAIGMNEFCKCFLDKEKYAYLKKEGAFDIISDKKKISKCFENGFKIFSTVCMKGSEFISDYVEKNYIDAYQKET